MKIALLPTLVAIAWIGLLANVQVVAQNGSVAPASGPVAPSVAAPATPPGTAPAATAAPTTNDPTLMDNGLWGDASVGPCCATCGGGNCCPSDWYTLQGTRIISRSNLRKALITSQTPPGGTYGLSPVPNPTTEYFLHNNNPNDITVNQNTTPGFFTPTQAANTTGPSEVLNTKNFGLGIAAGYDVTIGHYFCRDSNNNDHFVEFTFWGLNSWTRSKTLNGYLVPIYDETFAYTNQQDAVLITQGQETPQTTGNFQGSLQTPFPMAGVQGTKNALGVTVPGLLSATPQQQTLSQAFNYGTEQDFYYRSTMNNFEINGRFSPRGEPDRLVLHPDGRWERQCQPGTYMSYLYGIRYMQLDETFGFQSYSFGPYNNDSTRPPQHAVGEYDIATHNDMLGIQIGADMMFRQCRWAWGIESKVGPYINFANQTSTIDAHTLDGPARTPYDQRLLANRYQAALIGEVGFLATYKFRPNLMGRASYDFMWVTGVALAPDQLQFSANPDNRINTNGTVFCQGVSLGLEWMW